MERYKILLLLANIAFASTINLDYLDPTKLQTRTSNQVQQNAALRIIKRYLPQVSVEVSQVLFNNNKDVFSLRTTQNILHIRASSGVAAVWGFNYYLKKYCKSQIAWQKMNVKIPDLLPEVDEYVISNDRFRYYQNVCTASYSFAWWTVDKWLEHIEWMALNGINLALAPVAQEAAWARVYNKLGLRNEEVDEHFTGPGFIAWLRMGNVHGWGGPLPQSWHDAQRLIQDRVIDYMYQLGMVPVLPAFNGHVPRSLQRLYPNTTFHGVGNWNGFTDDYCCGLFLEPTDPLFKDIGRMFLTEITSSTGTGHIYTADPFNEVSIETWSTTLVSNTATAIYETLTKFDNEAVWLIQNWMFVHDPLMWPKDRVKSFITAVPNGRMLVLDLQAEQWPQYFLYDMYFGQPFIWCMLHNFGGTLGMFGNMQTINKEVYAIRSLENTTMIGTGLTPEGINQNYVVYDLMLESAWRTKPVKDLGSWVEEYAERSYGCNGTGTAWRYLLKSVYNFDGLNRMRGKYVITRRPSFQIKPWAWYKSYDLFEAWRRFVYPDGNCVSPSFKHDLVDVTRQALQYRAEQIYLNLVNDRLSNTFVFNATINQFLDVMNDLATVLSTDSDFTTLNWLPQARAMANGSEEVYLYELNARNQITLWGPNGEITDYACKQWAELFYYYYIPRWQKFLEIALDAKVRKEKFNEKSARELVRRTVEKEFATINIVPLPESDAFELAKSLYRKWAVVPDLVDLPIEVIRADPEMGKATTYPDTDDEEPGISGVPTVVMLTSTTTT